MAYNEEFYWWFNGGPRGRKIKWSKFTEDGNRQMNAHLNAPTDGPCAETFTMNHTYTSPYSNGPKHTAYKIDLGKMEQTNPQSTMVREIEGYWMNEYNGVKFNWNEYQKAKTAKLSYPPPEAIEDQGYQSGQAASAAGLPSASGSADQNGQTESAQTSGSQPSGNLPSAPGLAREAVAHPCLNKENEGVKRISDLQGSAKIARGIMELNTNDRQAYLQEHRTEIYVQAFFVPYSMPRRAKGKTTCVVVVPLRADLNWGLRQRVADADKKGQFE